MFFYKQLKEEKLLLLFVLMKLVCLRLAFAILQNLVIKMCIERQLVLYFQGCLFCVIEMHIHAQTHRCVSPVNTMWIAKGDNSQQAGRKKAEFPDQAVSHAQSHWY